MSDRSATSDWVRKRLVAYEAGLLAENEEVRFLDLVTHDPECQGLWRTFVLSLPEIEPSPEHPPLSLVRERLEYYKRGEGVSFDLLSEHFQACPDCREQAQADGIDLGAFLSVRRAGRGLEGEAKGSTTPQSREHSAERGDDPLDFLKRLFSPRGMTIAWATAATLATIVLLPLQRANIDLLQGGSIGLVTRSAEVTAIPTGPDGFYLLLEPPLELSTTTRARVLVLDSSGRRVAEREGQLRELCRPNLIVVRVKPRKNDAEASYTLVLRPAAAPEVRFPFKTLPPRTASGSSSP